MTIETVRGEFVQRVEGVIELLQFDDLVLEHLVGGLSDIVDELDRRNLHSAAQVVGNRLKQLKNIRSAQSLRHAYGTIYNQCVVLLVSYSTQRWVTCLEPQRRRRSVQARMYRRATAPSN